MRVDSAQVGGELDLDGELGVLRGHPAGLVDRLAEGAQRLQRDDFGCILVGHQSSLDSTSPPSDMPRASLVVCAAQTMNSRSSGPWL